MECGHGCVSDLSLFNFSPKLVNQGLAGVENPSKIFHLSLEGALMPLESSSAFLFLDSLLGHCHMCIELSATALVSPAYQFPAGTGGALVFLIKSLSSETIWT